MERKIDFSKKISDICSTAMEKTISMLKARNINVLKLDREEYPAYGHCYLDGEDEWVSDEITAVCIGGPKNNILFYTTDRDVISNFDDTEDIYTEDGEYDYNKLYGYEEPWCSFFDGMPTDIVEVYNSVYYTLLKMEENGNK